MKLQVSKWTVFNHNYPVKQSSKTTYFGVIMAWGCWQEIANKAELKNYIEKKFIVYTNPIKARETWMKDLWIMDEERQIENMNIIPHM